MGQSASSTHIGKQPLRDTEPTPDIALPGDDLAPGDLPDAGSSTHDETTPLTTDEAKQIAKTREEWRSIVAPELSGGRKGEWKTLHGGICNDMILAYIN